MTTSVAAEVSSRDVPSARALAKQLVTRAARTSGAPTDAAKTALAACESTYRAIARCIGTSGAKALLGRALSEANKTHPLLRNIRLDQRAAAGEDIADDVFDTTGGSPSADGLEALLEVMLTLLARFVGMDMVVQLVAQSATIGTKEDEDHQ